MRSTENPLHPLVRLIPLFPFQSLEISKKIPGLEFRDFLVVDKS